MSPRPRRRRKVVSALGETVYAATDADDLAAYRRDAEIGYRLGVALRALSVAARITPAGSA